jgi:hypothetical protein
MPKEAKWKRQQPNRAQAAQRKGFFKNEGGIVTSLLSRDEFYSLQSERFVEETFNGSLPAFLTLLQHERI